ncbi:MAG TPA: DUF3037 domain-containing protein [Candidatus Limnocylindrales bacterium]|nr:DUF3037 domain-containing protein [Candidatus Limnocylindrales bacterium]
MTPSRSPFSYAVLRVVPDIEREEFVNAGLVLFCRSRRYLRARTSLDAARLSALRPNADIGALRAQLALIEQIADGEVSNGPLAGMSQSERFHWLTTPRSTAVQPGPIHGGMADDPDATFEHLYATLVDRFGGIDEAAREAGP